ncbi:MAG: hypothetical protein M9958_03370 [Chitinophagales bacterium]|nr:hypothetical protein [Chitinophagales bacterium]
MYTEKTKKNNSWNTVAVKTIEQKYGITHIYVRECLRGAPKSILAHKIREDYKRLTNELDSIVQREVAIIAD